MIAKKEPLPFLPVALDFWAGGGAMGERIRNHPWELTAMGPAQHWPQSLKITIGLMLGTQHPVIIWWGPHLLQFYNDAYAPLIGPERHPSSLGQSGYDTWREIWPIIGLQVEQVMHGGISVWHENALVPITRGGVLQDCWWTYSYSPIAETSAAGGVGGVMVIAAETTASVQAQKIRERDSVWRNAPDLFVTLNTEGVFLAVNPAWQMVLGHAPEEVLGRSLKDFVWPEDMAKTQVALEETVAHHGARQSTQPTRSGPIESTAPLSLADFRNRYTHKDGNPRWISWYTAHEGNLIFGYGRDVTREEQQNQALADSAEQLRQAQKMEAVGQLTGGIAHDFNNLLAGIIGSLALLERQLVQEPTPTPTSATDAAPAPWQRHLVNAQAAARRAAALTHRLLAFSRLQTLAPEPVDLPMLITGMAELIATTAGPAIEVRLLPALETLWPVVVDKNQLENALLNLCINARDAMPGGGVLTIACRRALLDKAAANALAPETEPGAYVQLQVSDTGCGMDAAVMRRAFDPFFTTKPVGQGTGLGLSMIYGFARQSGGFAALESAPGQGTRASVYLPRYQPALASGPLAGALAATPAAVQLPVHFAATYQQQPGVAGLPSAAQHCILVVDDEPVVRSFVAEVLRGEGHQVLEAGTAQQALHLLRQQCAGQRVSLLVTDVGLPAGMNGRQLAEAACALLPGLKVLFITGYAESAAWHGGCPPVGIEVLVKPFEIESLIAHTQQLLALPSSVLPSA